jgi:hypothetical protein
MSRRPGDTKKLLVKSPDVESIDWVPPNGTAWRSVEDAAGLRISDQGRDHFHYATAFFATGAWSRKVTANSPELVRRVQLWRKRTNVLHKFICDDLIEVEPDMDRGDVIKLFKLQGDPGIFRMTGLLVYSIRAAFAASTVLLREIEDPDYPHDPGPLMWSLWVAILARSWTEQDLPLRKKRGHHLIINPGFLQLVKVLQETLPTTERRRREAESLRKGVNDALKKFSAASTPTLLVLFGLGLPGGDRLSLLRRGRLGEELGSIFAASTRGRSTRQSPETDHKKKAHTGSDHSG